jgi:hypothetical protein
MSVDELRAELKQIRLKAANLRYSMTESYPDWIEAAAVHLREYEKQERDLLAQLGQLEQPASKR